MAKSLNIKNGDQTYVTRTDAVSQFLRTINKYKVLSPVEERELFKRLKEGDMSAREDIIKHNQRFVFAVAKTYATDERVLDLVNEGNIGLMQAIDSYDYTKDNRFLSYAVWYIRRSIHAYVMNDDMFIHKTNNTKTVYHINKIRSKFFNENGRYPTEEELIDLLNEKGVKINDAADLYDLRVNSISTNYDDEDGNAFENSQFFTSRTSIKNEYEDDMDAEYKAALSGALMSVLDEREKSIIEYAFGIGHCKAYTNNEIGDELGMSAERVRQLKNSALKKMREVPVERRI